MNADLKDAAIDLGTKLKALHPHERLEVLELLLQTADFCVECGQNGRSGCFCTRDE